MKSTTTGEGFKPLLPPITNLRRNEGYIYRFKEFWATCALGEVEPGHYIQIEPVSKFDSGNAVVSHVFKMMGSGFQPANDPGRNYVSPMVTELGFKSEREMQKAAFVWAVQIAESESGTATLFARGKAKPAAETKFGSKAELENTLSSYSYEF
ncbi:MAG: hypothetical protein KDK35_21410 [Leptospiraceae bacterium]|nr:hypothetical protein [Leptospiraceae bacterium]